MQTVQLNELALEECWVEGHPSIRHRACFPLFSGGETDHSNAMFVLLDPGRAIGPHVDTAEEILVVLQGTVEIEVGDERARTSAESISVIPRMVRHDVRNVGSDLARVLSIFASVNVVTAFEFPLQPAGHCVVDSSLL